MLRKANHNIFVGDRAYQTTFFLNFKSPMSEQKFQADTFLRTKYFLQGYVLTCLCYIIWNFINSTCFNFYHDCKHTTLLIISLVCLIGAFPAIKKKSLTLIGLLFLAPNLYIHLVLIDTYSYHLAVHFTVVQTTIASALVFHTWKLQLISNVANYILLAIIVKFLSLEFLTGGNAWQFLQDILLHHILALLISAYIEKGRRERWVLLDTFKKSETIFISLVESILIPVFVVDSNKRVLYANKHAQGILRKYFKNITGRVPLHKMNVVFSSLLTHESQKILDKLLINSALEQESQAKIVLKDVQDEQVQEAQPEAANPQSAWSTLLGTRLEQLLQSSNNIYQVACTKILWKKSYANLLCIQDITKTLKVQEVMSSNLTKLIDEARTYVEAASENFESYTNATAQNNNYKPLIQAISHVDKLRYSLQNTSMAYDIACGKFRIEMERFNIRDHIIYMLEVLSIQTIKQKLEMKLFFELSFPTLVTGDYLKFIQLLHNLLSSVIEHCKDGVIKINCNMKSVDMTQEKYLLEFDIEFPRSQTLQFQTLRDLMNEEYQQDTATNILKKNDFESRLLLFRPLLAVLNGTSSTNQNSASISVKIEVPFSTNPPSPSNRSQRRAEPIPSFTKFHFTNTRTSTGNDQYKWDAQPNTIPSPVVLAPPKPAADSCPSPVLSRQLSEKIKLQFSEAPAVGAVKALSTFANHGKTPSYQTFKKQEKIRQNLLRISGENLSGFGSDGSSVCQSATPEPVEKAQRVNSQGRDEEGEILKNKEKKGEDKKEPENLVKVVKKKSNALNDGMPQLLKSPGVVKALEMSKAKAQSSGSTEQTSQQPDSALISKPEKEEKTVEQPPKEVSQEKSQWEETKNTYKEAKARPGSCQLENQKMLAQINHKRSITTAEPSPATANIKINNARTPQQSLFSPASIKQRRSSELVGMSNKLLSKYLDPRKGSIDSSDAGDLMFLNDLRSHEKLLKIAIGNVLIEVITIYNRNPNSYTLHISKLDLDRSAAIDERDERISPSPSELQEDVMKEEPSLVSLESDNKDFALRETVKASFHSDKLSGDELLERVMNYISNRLTGTKSEKEFVNFLTNYVRIVEKKLKGFCNTVSVTPYGEEEKEFYDQLMLENNDTDKMRRQKTSGSGKLNKVGSSESIFSMGSDASNGEKMINLTERILMSPAVKKMLTFRHNPTKMIQKVVEVIEGINGKVDKSKHDTVMKKKQRKNTVDTDSLEKMKRRKEDYEKELLPFGVAVSVLPIFMTVRTEMQRRRWKGGALTVYSKDKKSDFKYHENFTILAVDDSNFILDGLKMIVTPYKKQFEFAKDGLEAFTKFQSISKQGILYHLVLMDINMPKCGGIESTRLIRAYEKENNCPSTYICGLSAFEDPNIKKECFEAGMDDFCFKPLDSKKLADFIETRCKALSMDLPLAEKR